MESVAASDGRDPPWGARGGEEEEEDSSAGSFLIGFFFLLAIAVGLIVCCKTCCRTQGQAVLVASGPVHMVAAQGNPGDAAGSPAVAMAPHGGAPIPQHSVVVAQPLPEGSQTFPTATCVPSRDTYAGPITYAGDITYSGDITYATAKGQATDTSAQ